MGRLGVQPEYAGQKGHDSTPTHVEGPVASVPTMRQGLTDVPGARLTATRCRFQSTGSNANIAAVHRTAGTGVTGFQDCGPKRGSKRSHSGFTRSSRRWKRKSPRSGSKNGSIRASIG